jgi:hypothetical protein
MSSSKRKFPERGTARHAENMVVDALRSGLYDAATVVEMIHYAAEPDLVAAIRLIASLSAEDRTKTIAHAQGLQAEARLPVSH